MRALKLAGLVTCSIALAATTALAEPRKLENAELDGVTAGQPVLFEGLFVGQPPRPQQVVTIRSFVLDRKVRTVRSSDGGGGVAAQIDETPDALLLNPPRFVQDRFGFVVPRGRDAFFSRGVF